VLAANPAGAARLGLRPDAASGTLDAAMPGLVRLRALMHEVLNGGRREPLIFWTAYGAESLECNVKSLSDPDEPKLVLVSIAGDDNDDGPRDARPAAAAQPQSTQSQPHASPAVPASLPPSSEDAATMQKIARAIRTGFVKPTGAPGDAGNGDDAEGSDSSQEERAAHVSKLAHELRTPLSAIAVAAEIMKDQRFGELANERYRSYSSDIHDNARHALAVINRLLGDIVPDDAKEELQAVELDLNALAEGSISAMRPLAEKAGLTLAQELHTRLPHVVADPMTVKQILFNLLTNAVKFTKAGGTVRVVTGLGFDRSVFVAVQDTGSGMSADDIKRALNAEAPPKPERKEAGGGLGIGLPLAQSLAKSNGARLEIDSTPGEGTAVALIFAKDRLA
jgi:two-component system, cell cycle sensor histidine kinase PleC